MTPLRPAERLLAELGIERPEQIDLEAIAWTRGAAVKYRRLDRCEAMIAGTADRAIITVNSASIPERRRFSLAHEIGHWHHHRGRILFCGASDIGNPPHRSLNPESQADQFASDLVLPNYMFRPRILKMKRLSLPAVREIKEEFNVSLTATLLKLIEADRFPIIAVCHNKAKRRWFSRADIIPTWWFPRDNLDPESVAFEMLFGGAPESRFPRKIGADAWFDFRNAERFEIQEQSLLLPHEEVLTLLILPDEALE
jgi:Zn-dependent peptidase ImmA (M78 family)